MFVSGVVVSGRKNPDFCLNIDGLPCQKAVNGAVSIAAGEQGGWSVEFGFHSLLCGLSPQR